MSAKNSTYSARFSTKLILLSVSKHDFILANTNAFNFFLLPIYSGKKTYHNAENTWKVETPDHIPVIGQKAFSLSLASTCCVGILWIPFHLEKILARTEFWILHNIPVNSHSEVIMFL